MTNVPHTSPCTFDHFAVVFRGNIWLFFAVSGCELKKIIWSVFIGYIWFIPFRMVVGLVIEFVWYVNICVEYYFIFSRFCVVWFLIFTPSRIYKRFLSLFLYGFSIINEDRSYIVGFEFINDFVMLFHYILFYGAYVWEMVRKATWDGSCNMANVGISSYVCFQETLSKWTCKFINYIGLVFQSIHVYY